ncbi:MAG: TIGR00730 family Rossman fold protein [Bacteroidales bacterium]
MSKRICVYCSSSNILEEKYVKAAREFAQAASLLGYTIVCGGSVMGLMGVIIDTMIEKGSPVEGFIPGFMEDMEIHHKGIKQLGVVGTMSERKELLRQNSDAVIAFPGGLGTMEEFMETFTLKRLGQYDGSVILFNQDGFYDQLLCLFEHFAKNKFLNSNYRDSLIVVNSVDELITAVKNSKRERVEAKHYLPE